jgi:hypothetical protein
MKIRETVQHLLRTLTWNSVVQLKEYETDRMVAYIRNVVHSLSTYDLMLSRRVSIMKFSRVISRVRWFSSVETNVSKTISVLVLRVVELMWVLQDC